jgi:serine/threonine protein kinase/tetratricopeptide (TPR) repeat protein
MTSPGQLYGSYELIEPLGAGGMGEVWRGRHRALDRHAAIKLIRSESAAELDRAAARSMARRFEREARATSLLKSPHTVQIHDFGTIDDGTFYYAMELLEGLNQGELVRNEGPIEAERTVAILQQACESLAEAHDQGLIHRDIKPGNIFLCKLGMRYDHVKVLDFGLVKLTDAGGGEATQLTADLALGTPAFMPPEGVRGDSQIDERSDIYALGCVAYWLLTGQHVFEGNSAFELIMAHVEKDAVRPSVRTELDVPPELDAIIMSCLEKDPERRPQTAAELATLLAACPLARPWTPDRAKKWWSLRKNAGSSPTESAREAILRGELTPRKAMTPRSDRLARRFLGAQTPLPVRGRDAALDEVTAFVDGGTGVLLLAGEAGIGKTRLAMHALRRAEQQGATVIAGSCLDLQEPAPYMPFIDAWDDHVRSGGLSDNPFLTFAPSAGPQEDTLRLFRHVESSLAEIANGGAATVLIDDLHLADESSLRLLHFLARSSRTRRLMVVATCREEKLETGTPLQDLVSDLFRERLIRRVDLDRLGKDATKELIADLTGTEPSDETVASAYALSGGNPFFTEEIVQARRDAGDSDSSTLPKGLSEALLSRVAKLGDDVESYLRAAAVAGQHFKFDLVQKVSGLEIDAALDAAEAAVRARLLEEEDDGYRFRHALVRESIYGALLGMRRKRLHQLTADALTATTPDAHEELAFHFHAGGRLEPALEHFMAAGAAARVRIGYREALAFFEHARELMSELQTPPGPERYALLMALGGIRNALSEGPQAIADLDAAAELHREEDGWRPSSTERARALRASSLACMGLGDMIGMRERLDKSMAYIADEPDSPEWPETLYHYAQLDWHESRHEEAYKTAEQCLEKAEALGDPAHIARAYEMLALACHSIGEWKRGREYEESRHEIAGGQVDVAAAFDAHL